MALDWGMAAVIVAIAIVPLMISSNAVDFLHAVARRLRRLLWPKTAQCASIFWSDMPSDKDGLHDCGVTPDSCLHRSSRSSTHIVAPEC